MQPRFLPVALLFATSMLVSACTETIIRELPAESSDGPPIDGPSGITSALSDIDDPLSESDQSVPVPEPNPPINEPGTIRPGTAPALSEPGGQASGSNRPNPDTTVPITPDTANVNDSNVLADQGVVGVAGTPGAPVECASTLPCRWSSNDGAITVTATSADNTAARGRLSVSFTIESSHDTAISLGSSPDASSQSANHVVTQQSLGDGNGNAPQAMLAGTALQGILNYDTAANGDLTTWTLALFDNGLARNARFHNLPVGAAINADADCGGLLPCTWTTVNGDITVTLLSAGGFTGTGRLSAHYAITSTRDRTIAMDSASVAVGINGATFNSRTHELAQQNGYQRLTHAAAAGATVPGSVDFFRSESQPSALRSLMLSLFDDNPSPRWNPVFLNVPVL